MKTFKTALVGVLAIGAVATVSASAYAAPPEKGSDEVNVINDSTNPVPVDVQNTVPVEPEPYQAIYLSTGGLVSGTDNSRRSTIQVAFISGGVGVAITGLDLITRSTASDGYCAYTLERHASDTPALSDNKLWIHFDPSRPDTDLGRNSVHYNFNPPVAVTEDMQLHAARGGAAGDCEYLMVVRGRSLSGF